MTLIIYILATYRLSFMLVEEDGPFDIFYRIRTRLGIEWELDEKGNMKLVVDEGFFIGVFSCVLCMSVWIGILITIGHYLSHDIAFALSLPFALSAGAILIDKHINGG